MNRPAYQMSWSLGPGPAAVEARMRAVRKAEQPTYAETTERLWHEAQDPPRADGRGVLALAFDTAEQYRKTHA